MSAKTSTAATTDILRRARLIRAAYITVQDYIERVGVAVNREQAALVYAEAIARHQSSRDFRWSLLNRFIIERWSVSGLRHIKKAAWANVNVYGTTDNLLRAIALAESRPQ